MKRFLLFLTVLASLFSCEKEELPKPLTASPTANTVQVSMGSDYANQLFFDLASGTIIAQNNREEWDLGFECGADGRHVVLNSSKFMAMSATDSYDLASVNAQTATSWKYDNAAGKEDSSAFYNWELNRVYIVDRGNTVAGQSVGKVKMQITTHSETAYTIQWGTIDAEEFEAVTIEKDDAYNFIYLSFTTGNMVNIEPPKTEWDLCFTSYTHVFQDGTPYLVTGVLTNRTVTRAIRSTLDFASVDYVYASLLTYPTDLNVIGYDWKTYDFDLGTYVIQFDQVYILKSVEGRYYKLRFLDFYDQSGNKGTPSFELQELVP